MEAYLKWREENPDEGGAGSGGQPLNDPGAEMPENNDEDGDDYDDEEDE